MAQSQFPGSGGGISRRNFLKATGMVGAGFVLAPTLLAQDKAAAPAADVVNVAIIGAGTQGLVLLEQAVRLPGVRFKAVCDIWPYSQKYASGRLRSYNKDAKDATVNVYTDYQDMLDKEKDLHAVIVASPDWMHAEHAIACMKAGLNVYCEKEMSNDLEKAKQMVITSRETKKLLQIGHQRRSNSRYIHSHDKLLGEANLLNQITHIYGQWNRSMPQSLPRGFPKGQGLDEASLKKYGYDTMDRFRDWRWYKKFGGGPIADLGSHQIDIFGWFLGATPKKVMAAGGLDFYKDRGWEMADNTMAIYEFDTPKGVVRAYYQVLTTTGARGYFESFMGIDGTLQISESPSQCRVYAEGHLTPTDSTVEHPWEKWVKKGYLVRQTVPDEKPTETKSDVDSIISVYNSPPPTTFLMKVDVEKSYHMPHLHNFFESVRGKAKLNCPGEVGYETAVQVLKVNEAVAAAKTLEFKPEDFKV
jgi:predicted dehydrogenase